MSLNEILRMALPEAQDLWSLVFIVGWLGIIRSARYSGWRTAMIALPGTALHEMSHWLVGVFLLAKPISASIWPRRQANQWILGSVRFANLNIINSAPVAFAPLLLLAIAWLCVIYMRQLLEHGCYGTWFALSYISACCLFSCVPSTTDIRVGALSAMMYGAGFYAVWKFLL